MGRRTPSQVDRTQGVEPFGPPLSAGPSYRSGPDLPLWVKRGGRAPSTHANSGTVTAYEYLSLSGGYGARGRFLEQL